MLIIITGVDKLLEVRNAEFMPEGLSWQENKEWMKAKRREAQLADKTVMVRTHLTTLGNGVTLEADFVVEMKKYRGDFALTLERVIEFKPTHGKDSVATLQGKAYALKCLTWRRDNKPEQIDNGTLHSGSPMYFYCKSCGHLADVKSESYTSTPKRLCKECEVLKSLDWLE